jgi:hypothetical protein
VSKEDRSCLLSPFSAVPKLLPSPTAVHTLLLLQGLEAQGPLPAASPCPASSVWLSASSGFLFVSHWQIVRGR